MTQNYIHKFARTRASLFSATLFEIAQTRRQMSINRGMVKQIMAYNYTIWNTMKLQKCDESLSIYTEVSLFPLCMWMHTHVRAHTHTHTSYFSYSILRGASYIQPLLFPLNISTLLTVRIPAHPSRLISEYHLTKKALPDSCLGRTCT